jgi:integrase
LLQARPSESNSNLRVVDVIEAFLAWAKIHRSAESMRNFTWYGQKFAEQFGYLAVAELRPIHLTQFVDKHAWGQTTERNAKRSIYRAFSWADDEGLIASDPLKGMKCPGALARQRAMTDSEFRSLLRGSRGEFKILLFALRMTGCRPKEARMLTWDKVLEDRWVLPDHKTAHKTQKPRVVYLTPAMRKLMMVLRPKSFHTYVFLNRHGKPWTGNAVRLRMERLKRKLNLPKDLCCYHARHAFGTSAVLNGVDVLSVAALMGHSSLEMVQRFYVHLAGQHEHLHQAAAQATARPAASKPSAPAVRQDV